MKQERTLYISDLDGTLLNKDVEISKYSKQILNKCIENGMKFSIATARTLATVSKIIEDVDIKQPVILMNGALIYSFSEGKYIKVEEINRISLYKIFSYIDELNLDAFIYTISNNKMYTYYKKIDTKPMRDFYNERVTKYGKCFNKVDDYVELYNENVVYYCLMNKKEKLDEIKTLIENLEDIGFDYYQDIYNDDMWYLEIYSINASKYNALMFLRNYMDVDEVVGFGDNTNDIPLFNACNYKIAVANAKPEVIKASTYVIERNNDDGVARFLYQNFLKNRLV